jgi:hypothetical protein
LIGEDKNHTILKTEDDVEDLLLLPWINVTGCIFIGDQVTFSGFRIDDFCIEIYWDNNKITGNDFNSSCMLILSSNNQIQNNTFHNNSDDGGMGAFGVNNEITGNLFENNQYAMILLQGDNSVIHNTFSRNKYGLMLFPTGEYWETTGNITVKNNQFNDNTCGLYLVRYLIYQKYWCHIQKNNFIGNDQHAQFLTCIFPAIVQIPGIPTYPILKHELTIDRWLNNYWDDNMGIIPRVIPGKLCFLMKPENAESWPFMLDENTSPILIPAYGGFPFINIDWNPASDPYDIPIGDNI